MHILVVHERDGREDILSSCLLEWRQVLHHGRQTLSVELPGVGAQSALPVGSLEVKLELLPSPQPESRMTEAEVMLALKRERDAQVDSERRFFAYARGWWTQFLDRRPEHASRPVKLFAMSDLGTQRPVTAFVRPLRAQRLLETPRQAAHFVSLLRHHRDAVAASSAADVWRSAHATLATRAADTEEHALLLCSLLLGFGLEAYVCLGTDVRGVHAWVLTRATDGALTFWESTSAQQYLMPCSHPYLTLACVFNNAALYANCQPSTSLATTSLRLEEPSLWQPMDPALLQTVTPLPQAALQPSSLLAERGSAEAAAEMALRSLIDGHRASLGLSGPGVTWDDELAYLLSPALASYEAERVSGHATGSAHFADAIKRNVQHGHTFKGFPHHFVTYDANAVFRAWLGDETALSILQCRASKAAFAVRVRIQPLPDDVVSVWVMLAISYRPDA